MRRVAVSALIVLVVTLLTAVAVPDDEERAEKPAVILARMTWLAGQWRGDIWGGTFHAYYSTPEGGRILSQSQLVKGGKTVFYEFESFYVEDDIFRYQPYPGGKRAGGFTLTEYKAGERKATFENPKKDFPTRVVFHRVADDRLEITLSDPHGTSNKVEIFKLARPK